MKTLDRRDFLKKATLAGASALAVPTLFESCTSKASASTVVVADGLESKLIVPKNNGLKITGTFLDEISHDIPHQNWGTKEWDKDFKALGVANVFNVSSSSDVIFFMGVHAVRSLLLASNEHVANAVFRKLRRPSILSYLNKGL